MTKLTDSIKNMRQHGDAVRIAAIVNKQRVERGEEKISPAYVRSMLNGMYIIIEKGANFYLKSIPLRKDFKGNKIV